MLKSIRSKLILLFGAILVTTVLLQLFLNVFYAEKFYVYQKSNRINKVYQMLEENYVEDTESLYQMLKKEEEASNIRIIILSEHGQMIYITAHDRPFRKRQPPQPAEIRMNFSIFKENATAVLQKNPMTNEESLVLCGIFEADGEKRYVMMETPVSSIQTTVEITNRFTMTVALLALAVGILFVWLFSTRLTKPIKKIDKIAQNVANLDFSERADAGNGRDEIAHLSQNINRMSDRLSQLIQELQAANAELEQDNQYKTKVDTMRKEFVANVSHELKTPISLLIGYAEMLKHDIAGIDKDFYYDVILDESNKMNRLVSSLLDVSKLESGMENLKKETVDVNELVDWILEKNTISLQAKQLTVKKTEIECRLLCDKLKIEQVITNYIINAVHHARENTALEITLEQSETEFVFRVYNEGVFIEDKDIKKIWNSFYKADESRTDRNSTGLGLYIVKTIVQAHGGEVAVENKANGVEFSFCLPLQKNL